MGTPSVLKKSSAKSYPSPIKHVIPEVELIYDDGEPMESDWHVKSMTLLISSVQQHLHGRDDYYVGGNMFIYYNAKQARNRDFRGPDFFFVKGTNRQPIRKYWVVWLENGRVPDVVIELCSSSTIAEDHGRKKRIYQNTLHVSDYFCYDPDTQTLKGWRLKEKKYVPLKPNAEGRLWSEELGLWIGPWQGKAWRYDDVWLRFFDRDGKLVLSETEAAQQQAEAAQHQADAAQQQAEAAQQQAENDRRAREEATAENARLRAKLAALEKNGHSSDNGGKRKKK